MICAKFGMLEYITPRNRKFGGMPARYQNMLVMQMEVANQTTASNAKLKAKSPEKILFGEMNISDSVCLRAETPGIPVFRLDKSELSVSQERRSVFSGALQRLMTLYGSSHCSSLPDDLPHQSSSVTQVPYLAASAVMQLAEECHLPVVGGLEAP